MFETTNCTKIYNSKINSKLTIFHYGYVMKLKPHPLIKPKKKKT